MNVIDHRVMNVTDHCMMNDTDHYVKNVLHTCNVILVN